MESLPWNKLQFSSQKNSFRPKPTRYSFVPQNSVKAKIVSGLMGKNNSLVSYIKLKLQQALNDDILRHFQKPKSWSPWDQQLQCDLLSALFNWNRDTGRAMEQGLEVIVGEKFRLNSQ